MSKDNDLLCELWYGKRINVDLLNQLIYEIREITIRDNIAAWTHGEKEINSNFSDKWFHHLYRMRSDAIFESVETYLTILDGEDKDIIPDRIFNNRVTSSLIEMIRFLLCWTYLHNLSYKKGEE